MANKRARSAAAKSGNQRKSLIVLGVSAVSAVILWLLNLKAVAVILVVVGVALAAYFIHPAILLALATLLALLGAILGANSPNTPSYTEPQLVYRAPASESPVMVAITRLNQVAVSAEFDLFRDRISKPVEVERIITGLQQAYSIPSDNVAFQGLANDLKNLYRETLTDISNASAEDLTKLAVESLIAGMALAFGFTVAKKMLKTLETNFAATQDPYISRLIAEYQPLIDYFVRVPKSRRAEIAAATNLPENRILALLEAGPFTHEPACFWRYADRNDSQPEPTTAALFPTGLASAVTPPALPVPDLNEPFNKSLPAGSGERVNYPVNYFVRGGKMDPVTIITIISAGLKLVDQFRDLVIRFRGQVPTPPSGTAEQADTALEVRYGTQVTRRVEANQLHLDQWDTPRYEALNNRITTNWEIYNDLFSSEAGASAQEGARIRADMRKVQKTLCGDFKEMVHLYERALGTSLPDHYQLLEVCQGQPWDS
jgi:hypothetical protein